MPEVLNTAEQPPITPSELLNFKTSKSSFNNSLVPIQQTLIPNYDANKASQYVNNPTFNTLNPQRGYLEMENDMSQGQSTGEQWMRGLTKGVANIPLKFMEGMGYAYGLTKWGFKDEFDINHVDDLINNDFAKYFHEASKSLDTTLPIYGSFDYNEGKIVQKMLTAKFWAGDFVDGLSFLASAYGGSFIGKGIGKGASLLGTGVGVGVKGVNTINKWGSFAAGTIYNTISESGFEAKDAYDNVYKDLETKLGPELAKERASQAAANVFTSNLFILTVSNAFEMKAFMGNPRDESMKLFRQIARGEVKAGEISAIKEGFKGLGKGITIEGLYEEGSQNAIQQFQKKKAQGFENGEGFTGGYFNEWLKGWKTTEGQASMMLGALIGGPFQAKAHFSDALQKEASIEDLTAEVGRQREYLKVSDKIFQSYIENRYKKDDQGKTVYNDQNEPVLNEEWFKEKAFQIQLDEDYRNEKIAALLKGDVSHAAVVDQYYVSRKLWDYLANPLYETTDEALKAFKEQLKTQSEEYKQIADDISKQKLETSESKTVVESLHKNDEVENARFAKDMQNALANVEELKLEFDNIQKQIEFDPSNPKSTILHEKVSKALFHEVTKRKALTAIIKNTPDLTEAGLTKLTTMIQSSEEFSKKLLNKEERAKYIDDVKSEEEIVQDKVKEYFAIKDKYKEQPEVEKTKSKVESLKDKTKELLKPVISKFDREKKAEEAKVEETKVKEEKPKTLEEKLSEKDKKRLKILNYEIGKYSYQNGKNYLGRINDAYGNDVAVGKKYKYYKELGEETIRKTKAKDSIESIMDQITMISSLPIDKDSYVKLSSLLEELISGIYELTKALNSDLSQTNFTSTDLKYVEELQKRLEILFDSVEENIKDKIDQTKKELSSFNVYIDSIDHAISEAVNFINDISKEDEEDFDDLIDGREINTGIYTIFGPDLVHISFMANYFIDKNNREAVVITQAYQKGDITKTEALEALAEIIDNYSVSTDSAFDDAKNGRIEEILADVPIVDTEKLLKLSEELDNLEKIEKDYEKRNLYTEGLENLKKEASKYADSNKFLQLWTKDMPHQDEFFESLFIKENPEFSYIVSNAIVDKYKRDIKENNQTELDKYEDVFYYRSRLDELKSVFEILSEKEIVSKELLNTRKKLHNLIGIIENKIIPLAIKNQNNRKTVQETSVNIRDKNYLNQLGLNVDIDPQGNMVLKETTDKLIEEINKIFGSDVKATKFPKKFSFLIVEDIINQLKGKTEEELKPLFKLIEEYKKDVALEIQKFENTKGQAPFLSNTVFDNYIVNPESVFERLIYDMSSFEDKALRTYEEKENWFSSPLYNYSKHLSPALLLDELKKKKFSGSLLMPYNKLVEYLELHLEHTALFNLEKNLKSDLNYLSYYNNLKDNVTTLELSPTYQQEIALREAYEWWNDKTMLLSYLKGVAGTGKTSVFLKYFLAINKVSLDNVVFAAHNESATNTLKAISPNSNGLMISELIAKQADFFTNTTLLVIDEINANSDTQIKQLLDKITTINKTRAEDNKLKVLFMGDPTQLRMSNKPFIDYFSNHSNSFAVKYGNVLRTFSPLTVAYRSDVGAINILTNSFRDTNQVIQNVNVQSSGRIDEKETKGSILLSTERNNGVLDDIFKRLEVIKEENTTKAIIVSNEKEVALYNDELVRRKIDNVEVVTIENAQGRTFDEVYVDLIKSNLLDTNIAQNYKDDSEYFYNTAMYTAISRAKNLVLVNDNNSSFTHSIKDEVAEVNKDLIQEKAELKIKMLEYITFASNFHELEKEPITPEEKEEEEEKEKEEEEEGMPTDDIPGEEESERDVDSGILEEESTAEPQSLHYIQNPEVNVLEQRTVAGVRSPPSAIKGNEVIYMKSSNGNIYAYVEDTNNPEYYRFLTIIYPESLRDSVPSEKHLKNAYYNNTVPNLIKYTKDPLFKNSINRTNQIASGKIDRTQKLKFVYEKVANRSIIEQAIADKGGLFEYIKEKILPLITIKGSETETYGKIIDYKVFVATEQDKNNDAISSIDNVEFESGHPYLKFKIEKTDKEGKIRIQEFFIKLDSPILKNTDGIIAPLITFYNSITNIEKMFEHIGLSELKLGNNDFSKLILKFKKDFTVSTEKRKNFKNQDYDYYTIVPKEDAFVTKEDIKEILKAYNLSDANLSDILATIQKESRDLIPVIYSAKKTKPSVSSYGYINFLQEQIDLGNVREEDIQDFLNVVSSISGEGEEKQMNEIALNKTELSELNVIKTFRAFGYDLNALNENIFSVIRSMRRDLTKNSFVPIIAGENKGMFYAFDPLIGRVVVIEKIPTPRFVSRSFTEKNNIQMFDYETVGLTKKNSPVQYSFNSISRSNGVINKGTPNEIPIRLSYVMREGGNERNVIFAPSLLKENKFDSSFDSKYYGLIRNIFDTHIQELKAQGKPYVFNLAYEDDYGNMVDFQYKEALNSKGESIWKKKDVIGGFRKEASLQHENALRVMKEFLVSQGAKIKTDLGEETVTEELLHKLEETHTEVPITSKDLESLAGPSAFDENGNSKVKYRKNVDRSQILDSQDTTHGGKSFENNVPLQNSVTTRLKQVIPSNVVVSLNGMEKKEEKKEEKKPEAPKAKKAPAKKPKIERKTMNENSRYSLDIMPDGKFKIFDNGEFPQELFEYEVYEEALAKFNELSETIEEIPSEITSVPEIGNIDYDFIRQFIAGTEAFNEEDLEIFNKRFELLQKKLEGKSLDEVLEAISDKFEISLEILEQEVKGKNEKDKC